MSSLEVAHPLRANEIIILREEVAARKERLLRFAAESENQKKRLEREKAEATLYAASNFARDLLAWLTICHAPWLPCLRMSATSLMM